MENFRPPAMDQVVRQKHKKKIFTLVTLIPLGILLLIGVFFSIRQLKLYINYLALEEKYQLLRTYYSSLQNNNLEKIYTIAPQFNESSEEYMVKLSGEYAIYIYPSENQNKMIYTIVDKNQIPNLSYLKEVEYGYKDNKIIIKAIQNLGKGYQI